MAELVYAYASEAYPARVGGPSPLTCTFHLPAGGFRVNMPARQLGGSGKLDICTLYIFFGALIIRTIQEYLGILIKECGNIIATFDPGYPAPKYQSN